MESSAEDRMEAPGLARESEPVTAAGSEAEMSRDATPNTLRATPDSTGTQADRCPRTCGICNKEPGKYKCPRCSISYCSIACSRIHKESHPPPADLPSQSFHSTTTTTAIAETNPRRQAEDPYAILLEHGTSFRRLFAKYPHLEAELVRIQATTQPPTEDGSTLLLQKLGGSRGPREPWTRDLGLRNGAAALRRARADPTDLGDGVREYCELVLHLLSQAGATDAAGAVRREIAAEEAKAVEKLLAGEEDRV